MVDAFVSSLVSLAGAFVAVGGLVISAIKVRADKGKGVSESEQTSRRDTIDDRDSLIDQFQEALDSERKARIDQVQRLEARVSTLETALSDEREYTQALRDHIYRKLPPPPPQRFGTTAQPAM